MLENIVVRWGFDFSINNAIISKQTDARLEVLANVIYIEKNKSQGLRDSLPFESAPN